MNLKYYSIVAQDEDIEKIEGLWKKINTSLPSD